MLLLVPPLPKRPIFADNEAGVSASSERTPAGLLKLSGKLISRKNSLKVGIASLHHVIKPKYLGNRKQC
jgi:hypothetical protein